MIRKLLIYERLKYYNLRKDYFAFVTHHNRSRLKNNPSDEYFNLTYIQSIHLKVSEDYLNM